MVGRLISTKPQTCSMASRIVSPVLRRFLFRFFAIFLVVEVFLSVFPPLYFQEWLARVIGNILDIPVQGIFVSVNAIRFEISPFCTGLSTIGLWLGLVYGFPFPPGKEKIRYALVGGVMIILLNVIRLLGIVYAGMVSSAANVDALHTLTWFIMSALACGMWYYLLAQKTGTFNTQKIAQKLLEM